MVSDMWHLPASADPDTASRVPFADCFISPEARTAATRVLSSGWITTGVEALDFEREFAAAVGSAHAVSVSSCTAALELALRSLRLPAGSSVLVSALTFCGAVHAIEHAGLQPVLVDVDPETGMPTPETTARAARTASTAGRLAAMVVVHWAGDPADVPGLAAAAGLPLDRVIEDAAHALGSEIHGEPIGAGAAVCFSFYATKNLPIGEGGMVTTQDPDRAEWIRRGRLHGMSSDAWRRYLPRGRWRYDVEESGLKANLTDLQAAIGRAQLVHLQDWQRRRATIVAEYDARLSRVPGLGLPHRPAPAAGTHAWHLYPIRVLPESGSSRDGLMAGLHARGVDTSVHFIPIHMLEHFSRSCVMPEGGLAGAELIFSQLLSLPLYPRLTGEQISQVCDAVEGLVTTSTWSLS